MRLKTKVVKLDYNKTKKFFEERSEKYNKENPYSVTMYQDNDTELVKRRNENEITKILPKLMLNKKSKILDIACGVGRWADAIQIPINKYYGIDFSEELIDIAKDRNKKNNFEFAVGSTNELLIKAKQYSWEKCNCIIIAGLLMYLNEEDIEVLFKEINEICENETIIYIREPIGIKDRLTLKDFYSEELASEYNAIYRTRNEYYEIFEKNLLAMDFAIFEENFVFDLDETLNNRKETEQYYFILKR